MYARAQAGPADGGVRALRAQRYDDFEWNEEGTHLINPETGREVTPHGDVAIALLRSRGYTPLGPLSAPAFAYHWARSTMAVHGAYRHVMYETPRAPVYSRSMIPAMIEAARAHEEDFLGIVLSFTRPEDPKPIHREIPGPLPDAATIAGYLFHAEIGYVASDPVSIDYHLDTKRFLVKYRVPARGGAGKASYKTRDTPLFRLADYKGAEGDCLITVLRQISGNTKGVRCSTIRRELDLPAGPLPASDEVLQRLSDYFRCGIEIVTSDLEIEREFVDSRVGGNTCVANATPVCIGRVMPRLPAKRMAHIHFDESTSHYEHILEQKAITLCPYTGDHAVYKKKELRERILEQGRTFYWCGKAPVDAPRVRRIRDMRRVILVFDFETTYDATTMSLSAYAASWFAYEIDRDDPDFSGEDASVALGDGCVEQLLDFILDAPADVTYTLVGFNNGRFDNFLLAQAAAAREALSDVFLTSGTLRDIRIGRHSTIDLYKLCTTSLDSACKSFGTSPRKLEGFSHEIPQAARFAGALPEWIEDNREKLIEYVTTDVLATCSLAVKLEAVFAEVVGVRPISARIGTIAGLAWHSFKEVTEEMPEAPMDETMDQFIRSSLTGGRTQNFETPGFTTSEPCRMVDVCSLYPTAMSGARAEVMPPQLGYGRYPLGQGNTTTEYVEGKLGFYHVRIVRQPVPNVLPKRTPDAPLDWKCTEPFETIAGSPSIELIRLAGGEVEILVKDGIAGYYYPRDTERLFDTFLGPIIAGKSEEDAYKEHKDPRYNPARREALKLIMNSLSGKWAQGHYDDVAVIAKGSSKQLAAERKMRGGRASWYPLCGETVLLVGKKDKQYNQKRAKPVQVAAFIYEHARSYMWWIVYSRYRPIYTDTDSALVRRADYDRFRLDFPQLDPNGRLKVLGDLEEELGSDSTHLIIIAPKTYFVDAPKGVKCRAKGLSLEKDYLLSDMGAELVSKANAESIVGWKRDGHPEMKPLRTAQREFFERVRDTGYAHVLSSSLCRGVEYADGFRLAQRFLVKTITNPSLQAQKEATPPEEPWDGTFDEETAQYIVDFYNGDLD